MASNLLTLQSFCLGFSANRYLNYFQRQAPSNPRSHPLISRRSTLAHNLKLNSVCRAATDGVPSELIEDSKFVPLNADDPRYGPPALLLLGFELEEAVKIQQLLKELDGEFLKVIYCTEDMIAHSLWQAIHTEQSNLETVKIAKSLPRICFLSGLSGEEMMMFIDAFPETGLEPAVFAALVPNSANKLLQEVIEEIMGDHEMLSARQSQSP
ncbi:PREDICTED: uncharacterized protein LOC104604527 isoform X2 [Nelumbo nucifera]|uniref:Uncharacterized protein LOC104604527 isoform X2 n=2 Tax=Nelumbo nucifera TaxID=4432 RepID=A0A1U8AW62_NELNU|nr:PREDICTED: uncharacterized protein LOC104604527 isoform X2 [Nelumbo nucifera]DAD48833.1 TPA_asm: hypothetical protein HUJ06_018770 [Nelumbo nucifera]